MNLLLAGVIDLILVEMLLKFSGYSSEACLWATLLSHRKMESYLLNPKRWHRLATCCQTRKIQLVM